MKEELEKFHLFSTLYLPNVKSMLLSELLIAHFSAHIDRASFLDQVIVCKFLPLLQGEDNFQENS